MEPQFTAVADCGLLVTFSDTINDSTHKTIISFDKAIAKAMATDNDQQLGIIEVVPALINAMVVFDPLVTDHLQLEKVLRTVLKNTRQQNTQTTKRVVQVCYHESFGFDMQAVVDTTGLSREAVINAHVAGDYKVLMYGFAPGYAYMGGVDSSIQVPRKLAAVRDIPAGCVMIAGAQCLITTLKMPTGWSIIGRSPTQVLFNDPQRPFLFDVGDQVTFEQIDLQTYEQATKTKVSTADD